MLARRALCPVLGYFAVLLCATSTIALRAQTITTLHSFISTDGADPFAGLIQASDGDFYGTTRYAGANNAICTAPMSSPGCGTIFKITATGVLTTLYNFCSQANCADGQAPNAGLVQGSDGNFYGTTLAGGAFGGGTIFLMTPGGTLITLYSFCAQTNCTDGQGPAAALIQGSDGNFYGTTSGGGTFGFGTVFQMLAGGGTPATLHSFSNVEGNDPDAPLVQGADGNLYGTTRNGGANNLGGMIFVISPSGGAPTILYSFCSQTNCTDGKFPTGLIQASDGNFYGTTSDGGATAFCGTNGQPCGTVFRISPAGAFATLHSFSTTDGFEPLAGLVQGTDGNFYGTTFGFPGTIFRITPGGALTTLYTFCAQTNCPDGDTPIAGLIQGRDGDFYGTTELGGTSGACGGGCGTVFSLQVPLPTVIPSPTSLDFGNQPVTTTSGPQPITVTNSGSVPLLIGGISPSGDFAESNNCPLSPNTLSTGAACTINVTFTPSVTGSRTGAITISDNVAGSPQILSLSGNGTDFSVSASPSTQTVGAGKSTTYTLSVSPISGYTGPVALSCSGAPPAGSCTISPNSASLNGTTTVTATVTTATAGMGKKGTPKGTYTLTLTGSFSTLSHSIQVTLTVK